MREGMLREIDTEYEARRAENRAEEERRLATATAADAKIGALISERVRLFQQGAREALSSPGQAKAITERLAQRIEAIQQELRARLKATGLPAEYLQPVYQCPHCHDTGFVGDTIRERCTCHARAVRERVAGASGHGLAPEETFEAYDETVYSEAPLESNPNDTQRAYMDRLRAICLAYADTYPRMEQSNLLLLGMSGLGKTYLMNCIGNRVRQRGFEAQKLTAYQLSERIRASVFGNAPEEFQSLLHVPLLLLDDLGVEPLLNNVTIEQLFTLINERSLAGLSTIISTNLPMKHLTDRYTERVCSRLFDQKSTRILQFYGTDVRRGRR